MPDADGYPTDDELQQLRTWDDRDPIGWLTYARSLWWAQGWGWKDFDLARRFTTASTGGWSGNETILSVMEQAKPFLWDSVFFAMRRGGHYIFDLTGGRLESEFILGGDEICLLCGQRAPVPFPDDDGESEQPAHAP